MIKIIFSKNAWEDYVYWQTENKKTLKKINALIKDIQRTPYEGIGKPEPLKFDLAGYWSRRIDLEHRLVYQVNDSDILIFACRFHYDKKYWAQANTVGGKLFPASAGQVSHFLLSSHYKAITYTLDTYYERSHSDYIRNLHTDWKMGTQADIPVRTINYRTKKQSASKY